MFLSFNEQLKQRLEPLVFAIEPNDKATLHKKLFVQQSVSKRMVLAIPAFAGFVMHAPLYLPIKAINQKYFNNDHFDSTVVALLMLCYPIYLILFWMLAGFLFGFLVALPLFLLLPFSAWCCVQLKRQI